MAKTSGARLPTAYSGRGAAARTARTIVPATSSAVMPDASFASRVDSIVR
jgi:hypothetical protein